MVLTHVFMHNDFQIGMHRHVNPKYFDFFQSFAFKYPEMDVESDDLAGEPTWFFLPVLGLNSNITWNNNGMWIRKRWQLIFTKGGKKNLILINFTIWLNAVFQLVCRNQKNQWSSEIKYADLD